MASELARPLLVLAAGRSSRLGEPKGLVEIGGRPFLAWQLERFAEAGGTRAIVVLGHDREAYEARAPWALARAIRVEVVVNPDPERGPFSSLRCGARLALATGAFVLPVDVPCAGPGVFAALERALVARAAVPVFEGRGGHPVLCSAELLASLVQIDDADPDARLDRQLARLAPPELARVEVDDRRVRMNLNTKGDWAALGETGPGR